MVALTRWTVPLVALVFVAACSAGEQPRTAEDAAEPDALEFADDAGGDTDGDTDGGRDQGADGVEGVERPEADGDDAGLGGAGGDTAELGDGDVDVQDLPPPVERAAEDRVIKEGTLALEVADGTFDRAFREVVAVARRLGGSVVSSTTRTDDDGATSGAVTVRVPVERYEDLLVDVGDVGEVRSRDVTAEDVSTEFVDLQSRQRNLEAQERFYLGLLDEADGVSDAIAVQQQLDGITGQLEQVKGRIGFLDARTRFSVLTVELFEPGAAASPPEERDGAPSLSRAFDTATDAFVTVVGALLVFAFFVAPLLGVGLVGVLLWRLARRGPDSVGRVPSPPSTTPPSTTPPPPPPSSDPDREREPQRTG